MSLVSTFVAAFVSAVTAFSQGYVDVNVSSPPTTPETQVSSNIDTASGIAQGSNMAAGIAVIDRGKSNSMSTNSSELSHREFKMESLGRLPILLYAIRVDPKMVSDASDAIQMMEASSGEAADRMWNKYGGQSIIRDTARRYVLEQTTAGNSWRDTTSTAVDVARMYRRFLDDASVSIPQKKWVVTVLRKTSPSISGEDFSWGLPQSLDVTETSKENRQLGWVQGYSPSGSNPMIRASTGIVGPEMRYIVVVIGQMPSDTSDSDANRVVNDTTNAIDKDKVLTEEGADSSDSSVEAFKDKQKKLYGNFVENN